MLGVFDAPAQVPAIALGTEGPLVQIQDLAIGAVTDRVDTQLAVVGDRDFGRAVQVLEVQRVQAELEGRSS